MDMVETPLGNEEVVRRFTRAEYHRLGEAGFFEDEKVELLFGLVVPMSPIDRSHIRSTQLLHEHLLRVIGNRADVLNGSPFAATDDSEPQPDIVVVPRSDSWTEHPSHAYLIVEVSRSSLRKDRGTKALLYSMSAVDEYWIVNHVNEVVEVYRDRLAGTAETEPTWGSRTIHRRGETIALLAFPDVTVDVAAILPPSA